MDYWSDEDKDRALSRDPLSRREVRTVGCPACGAERTEPCRGVRDRPRTSNHRERVAEAKRWFGGRDDGSPYFRDETGRQWELPPPQEQTPRDGGQGGQ